MNKRNDEYLALLNECKGEQKYQTFLEENTEFIPRHFVQNHGIHFDLVIRKLKISSDMVTDFVMLSKSSIGWNYILIEIEKPQSKYFKQGTLEPHSDFLKGIQQIKSWQAWFNQPENKSHFENQLSFLKKPISHAPVSICYVLVTGRRCEYENSKDKINLISSYQGNSFKIMSFDSLAENIEKNEKLYVGIRKRRSIEIVSKELLDTEFIYWCDESDYWLPAVLKNSLIRALNDRITAYDNRLMKKIGIPKIEKLIRKVQAMKVSDAKQSS